MAALAGVLADHPQVLVMTGDIYEHFIYDGATMDSFVTVAPVLPPRSPAPS